MTQDIGTAIQRVKRPSRCKWNDLYRWERAGLPFQSLVLILKKLGYSWAEHLYHLSYGMVDLPSGKMKSREGTVVDADDLIAEMSQTAKVFRRVGKIDDLSETEKSNFTKPLGWGPWSIFMLKVDPRKRMLFDPNESVDFQGNTGPFIQYTYARIQSILRKANESGISSKAPITSLKLHERKRNCWSNYSPFRKVQEAASSYSPALIANYTYDLVKEFNSFYQTFPFLAPIRMWKIL